MLTVKVLKLYPTKARFVNPVLVVRPEAFSPLAWQFACVLEIAPNEHQQGLDNKHCDSFCISRNKQKSATFLL